MAEAFAKLVALITPKRRWAYAFTVVGALLTVIGLALTPGALADDQADARAIVDKAIEAAGGKEALAKYQGPFYCETKGKEFQRDRTQEFTYRHTIWLPDRLRSDSESIVNGKLVTSGIVVNANKGWAKAQKGFFGKTPPPPLAWEELGAAQVAQFRNNSMYRDWVATLAPLADAAFELSTLDEIKLDDRAAVGVKVFRTDRPELQLYFDKETSAKVKLFLKATATSTYEEVYGDDYAGVDGVVYPKKVARYRNGVKFQEIEITKFEFIEPPADDFFDKP